MPVSRSMMPPMTCLMAFEAVARLGSVTDAARELDLTQSAVSRQIRKLEDIVGVILFERDRKRLRLTVRGLRYAQAVREALAQITTASAALRSDPGSGVLNLAILPSFGTHWLAPRVPDFLRAHPEITLNMSTRLRPFDFATEEFHAAIHVGKDNWPGTQAMKLCDERALAVAAPELLASGPAESLPKLELQTRPDAWRTWAQAQGWAAPGKPAMVVDQFATMLRAAQAGLGVALIPDYLVARDLDMGDLKVVPGTRPFNTGAYYLVWPEGSVFPALTAFREWLRGCAMPRPSA